MTTRPTRPFFPCIPLPSFKALLPVLSGCSAAALVFFTAASITLATPVGDSECFQAAAAWIQAMPERPDQRREKVLLSHSRSSCRFSGHWLSADSNTAATASQRRRTCSDLVLIWTHKECVYFRDTIFAPAYEPCKRWSRLMHDKCMAGDTSWFLENTQTGNDR